MLTSRRWANVVDAMYPDYTGARPRFQVYHGSIDTVRMPSMADKGRLD